jgi:hypothetical protein
MEASRLLLSDDAAAAWPFLEALMRDRPAFMEQVMLGTAGAYDRPVPPVGPSRIADLYLWMVERFPMHEDPTFDDAHWVGPREAVGRWRDELLESLRRSGTPDAVDAVRRIAAALPEARWLQRTQAGAENALREALWSPLSLAELARLAADSRARVIRSTSQLLDETVLAFHKIQDRLQGDTPDAPLLWDTYARRPKSEDEISDYLRNQLNTLLGDRAVIVNREVQIRPSTRGVGERSDLRIDAVTALPGAGPSPVLTVVGEVKGCWHRDVATAMQDQLVGRYMTDVGTPHGVYVVVWFDVDSWDDGDGRRQVTNGRDRAETLAALENQAALLRERGIAVAVVFLDASARRPPNLE